MIGKESQTKKGKEKEKKKKHPQEKNPPNTKTNHRNPKFTPAQKGLGGQSGARDGKRGIRAASSGEIDWVQVCCFAELLKASLIFRR